MRINRVDKRDLPLARRRIADQHRRTTGVVVGHREVVGSWQRIHVGLPYFHHDVNFIVAASDITIVSQIRPAGEIFFKRNRLN